jgi:hypothetical protein
MTTTYALLPGSERWHAIRSVIPGHSLTTVCDGRWPAYVERQELEEPPAELRCKECDRRLVVAAAFDTSEPVISAVEADTGEWIDRGGEEQTR